MRSEKEIFDLLVSAFDFADRALSRGHLPVASREDLRAVKAKLEYVIAVLNDKSEEKVRP